MNSTQYDTHQLREYAAKRLNLSDVPDDVWNKGITRQTVELWEYADSTEKKSVVQDKLVTLVQEDIRAVVRMGGDMTPYTHRQRRKRTITEANLSSDSPIATRAEALCIYWAKLAEVDKGVLAFRKKVLGGAAVSDGEAIELIASAAASLVSPEAFLKRAVPIIGHTVESDSVVRDNPFAKPYRVRGSLRLVWPAGEAVMRVDHEAPRPPEPMEIWNGIEPTVVAPWSGSVLGQLRKVNSTLTQRYPWEPSAAAWFVLTGEPPWVPPLTAASSGPDLAKNHGTITIRAAHWVPEEAVRELYSRMKSDMEPTHTTSRRRLALFRFVTERSSGINEFDKGAIVTGLNLPPWRHLQGEWNRQYLSGHKWHYKDVRNFRRDFAEAFKLLVGYY